MSKLQPHIIEYLTKKGNTPKEELVDYLHKTRNVPKDSIQFRIKKLVEKQILTSYHNLTSINLPETNKIPDDPDEIYDYGSIKLARKGKIVYLHSDWNKSEHEKFIKSIETDLPKYKQDTFDKLKEIEEIILTNFDPLDILAYVAANNLMADPEKYCESSFEGKQLLPEIVQNMILKIDINKYKKEINRDKIPEIEQHLDELWSN